MIFPQWRISTRTPLSLEWMFSGSEFRQENQVLCKLQREVMLNDRSGFGRRGKKLSVSASVRFVLPLGGGVGVIVAFGLDGWGGGGCRDDYCYDDDHANDILIHYGIATTTTEKGDEQDAEDNKRFSFFF